MWTEVARGGILVSPPPPPNQMGFDVELLTPSVVVAGGAGFGRCVVTRVGPS